MASSDQRIAWQAAEAIDYKRSRNWYLALYLIAVLVVGVCIWLQQWTTIVLVVIMVAAILVVNKQPSKLVSYVLSNDGLEIDGKLHDFSEYRSFSVHHDGDFWSLILLPVKRFATETAVYIRDEHGEEIVDLLGQILPMEASGRGLVDRISKKLKL